jgi:hypothetical protein
VDVHLTYELSSDHVIAPDDAASDKSDDFEDINLRKEERRAGRAEWEKLVFEPFDTDQVLILEYLRVLFGKNGTNKQATRALGAL